ncbi:MAG: hypothetical protein WD396_01275 [Pseudohongiellaceae bacterium]
MKTPDWSESDIRLAAVLASLLLSVYSFAFPELPNDDAYVYIRTAEIYLDQGLAAAFAHYGWAGYSILIALVSRLGPDLFTAAYLLNALFFALLVFAFVSLIAELNARRLVLILGALTVLLYPELNEFRWFIIRDIGFWAFSLTGVWLLLRFCRQPDWGLAAGFTGVFLAASAFRPEALLYLLALPLAPLADSSRTVPQRRAAFVRLALSAWVSLLLLYLLLLLAGTNLWQQLTDFLSVYLPFLQATFAPGAERSTELSRLLFGEHGASFSGDYLGGVIALGLLVVLLMTLLYGLSGAFFWMLAFGLFKGYARPAQLTRPPLLLAILTNTAILLVFLYVTRYLTTRYAMLLCLLLATQIPVVVAHLLDYLEGSNWRRLGNSLVVLFFVYCAFDAHVSFGRSRDYLLDAATFAAETAAPAGTVLTNNHTIAWFSGRVPAYDEVERVPTVESLLATRPGDVVVLELVPEVRRLLELDRVAAALEQERSFPDGADTRVAAFRAR